MAKRWVIDDGPPLKMRLVKEIERSQDTEPIDNPYRVRTIGRHIVKMLVALWVLSIGAWLSACDRGIHNEDGSHDAIGGQDDVFGGL